MRWLRLLGIFFLFAIVFLFGAFYSYRAVARKHARELETRLATLPDPAANTPYPKFFFQRGVNFTAEFPAFYGEDAAETVLPPRCPAVSLSVSFVPPKIKLQDFSVPHAKTLQLLSWKIK